MKFHVRTLALLLALAGCAPPAGTVDDPLAEYLDGQGRKAAVERVIDGDTLVLAGDERVRLLTIDTPELNSRSPEPPECGAEASRDALTELLPPGTPVLLNGLKGEPDTDRYGRTLSNVYVQRGGELVNASLWLAARGWATAYDDYPTADTPEAEALEAQARADDAGIWGLC